MEGLGMLLSKLAEEAEGARFPVKMDRVDRMGTEGPEEEAEAAAG